MKKVPISQDDLLDVMERADQLEQKMMETLDGNQKSLAISAVISASVSLMISNCDKLSEVVMYRNAFVETLDNAIENINN